MTPGTPASPRVRKASTAASNSSAITDTCDFDSPVIPRVSTRGPSAGLTPRVDSRWPPPGQGPLGPLASLEQPVREIRASPQLEKLPSPMCLCVCRIGAADSRCGSWCARHCAARSRPRTAHQLQRPSGCGQQREHLAQRIRAGAGESVGWAAVIALVPLIVAGPYPGPPLRQPGGASILHGQTSREAVPVRNEPAA
jgi:hypothetical protein